MIRKSLLVTFVLFVLYELFLRAADISWDTSQNDKSENIISAQDFIYNYTPAETAADTIIVGTSVSRKLVTDSLGEHYINLAFNAWSGYDGLELIKMSKKKPACLMIEMNYVKSQVLQPELLNDLKPVTYYCGKMFKSLHLRYQPTGLLVGWGKNLLKRRMEELKDEKRQDQALYNYNMKMNVEIMNQTTPDSVMNSRFINLKSLIDGFKKENVKIIFYEVPISEELENTASMVAVRKYFNLYFPPDEYRYIPMPAKNNYIFSDGVHLSLRSALAYTLYLRGALAGK